ncbi:MAG: serine/threonine protein kinase [Fimbriiglobus sp.]|nr:serine/threonine protein kinase [Fimbriiglobus sp.]
MPTPPPVPFDRSLAPPARRLTPAPLADTPRPPETSPPVNDGAVRLFAPSSAGGAGSCPSEMAHHGRLAPSAIPGYRIEGVIGTGGMGTVYLARQLSLDRPVALKVMSPAWASDAVFAARFVREAYAAAQLNHPNVVQIFDIGEYGGSRYFSMEYVAGKCLADHVRGDGPLDVETAVGYALQAARGLKHAHDRGIVHRDVKPDNLLIDPHGVVKVADLGLVKTPDLPAQADRLSPPSDSGLHTLPTDMTGVRMALGTPAYMAPEQCRDATAVDHRADIYSLGCTLYALVTGRQPFDADDSLGLMKKQAYEPPVPPELVNPRVPAEVSAIIQRMMAKRADERPRSMGEVIRTLEGWLGVRTHGPVVPRAEQIVEVERLTAAFFASPAAHSRARAVNGFVSAAAVAAVLLLFFGKVPYAFGVAGMLVQAAIAYFVIHGLTRKTYFYGRVRRFAAALSVGDWLVATAAAGLFAAFLWLSGLLAVWVGLGLIGMAAAVVLSSTLDQKREVERYPTLSAADKLVRKLRKQGWAEAEVKSFFAKFGGRHWEEFFEAVFGFEAKLAARAELRGGAAGRRVKFAAWREPVIVLLNHIESQQRKARERRMLEGAEYDRLVAAGIPKRAARERADATAAALVEQASVIRESTLTGLESPSQTQSGVISFRPLLQPTLSGDGLPPETPAGPDHLAWVWDALLGKALRAAAAATLIAACGLWVIQNDLANVLSRTEADVMPLALPGVPEAWTNWCDTVNAGWGGVLLLVSLLYRGHRAAALTLLGTAVVVFGHKMGIRTVHPVQDYHVSMFLGTVLSLIGWRLGRR